jgi:spore coat polysaccharide biosynthesis protein SpsF (cytidylyltransferase family)
MIDFAAALNEALNAAIDKKLEPLLQRRNALEANGLNHVVRLTEDNEVVLTAAIQALVDGRVDYGIEKHNEDYDHDDFVTESDLDTKVKDSFEDNFQSKVEAAIDGLHVTLNT